jgi:DNA-binding CsgD family transcriptional regulator
MHLTTPEEFVINETELKRLNLSSREYEVLQLLGRGYSNVELMDGEFKIA